jgi:hypothetical protein
MKTIEKSKQSIREKVANNPRLQLALEAKMQLVRKQLAGIEKGGYIEVKE